MENQAWWERDAKAESGAWWERDAVAGEASEQKPGRGIVDRLADTVDGLTRLLPFRLAGALASGRNDVARPAATGEEAQDRPTPQQIERIAERSAAQADAMRVEARRLNPGATPEQIEGVVRAEMDRPAGRAIGLVDRIAKLQSSGMSSEDAAANAIFNQRLEDEFNSRLARLPADRDTGRRIRRGYTPEFEADRNRLIEEEQKLLRDKANVERMAASFASSFDNDHLATAANYAARLAASALSTDRFLGDFAKAAARRFGFDMGKELGPRDITARAIEALDMALPELAKKDLWEEFKSGSPDFLPALAVQAAGNSPQLAMTILGMLVPGTVPAVLGIMGASQALTSYGSGDSAPAAAAKGAIEVGTELIPFKSLDSLVRRINELPLPVRTRLLNALGRKTAGLAVAAGTGAVTGAAEEALAQLGGNVVDRVIDGKDTPLMDGVGSAAILGGVTGKAVTTIGAAPRIISAPASRMDVVGRELASSLEADPPAAPAGIIAAQSTPGQSIRPEATSIAAAEAARARDAALAEQQAAIDAVRSAGSVDEAIAAAERSMEASSAAVSFELQRRAIEAQADQERQLQAVLDAAKVGVQQTPAQEADAPLGAAALANQTAIDDSASAPDNTAILADGAVFRDMQDAERYVESLGISHEAVQARTTPDGVVVQPQEVDLTVNVDLGAVGALAAAMPSGRVEAYTAEMLHRASEMERRAVDQLNILNSVLRQITGKEAVLVSSDQPFFGAAYDGRYYVNVPKVARSQSMAAVVGATLFHEAVHVELERSNDPVVQQKYAELKRIVLEYQRDGALGRRMLAENRARMEIGKELARVADIESEFVADVSGAMMISDPGFWARVYDLDAGSTLRRIGYKLMQYITRAIMLLRARGRFNVDELIRQREAVREALAQAWAARANSTATPFGAPLQLSPARRVDMRDATQEDYKRFRIPPAYTDAKVATDPDRADLLWTAKDAKGRTKYGYRDEYIKSQKAEKFRRMRRFVQAKPFIDKKLEQAALAGDERAIVLRLISLTGFRVGGDVRRSGGEAYGASTLEPRHVRIDGNTVHFDFVGKGGVRQRHAVTDTIIAEAIRQRMDRQKLFDVTDERLRVYLRAISGADYKVHDFRTAAAMEAAVSVLSALGKPKTTEEYWRGYDAALEAAAARIGDTKAVAESDYVDPAVFERWRDGFEPGARPRGARKHGAGAAGDDGQRQQGVGVGVRRGRARGGQLWSEAGPLEASERTAALSVAQNLRPLEGAPIIEGATGPDPGLVAAAEAYARKHGIDLKRQGVYVNVDEGFARRLAQAYDAMPHTPDDPQVRAAYDELIRQTRAQYDALVEAGYSFYFYDPDNPGFYADMPGGFSNPWNAMRELRMHRRMAVFPTDDGFGSSDFDPSGNPLLQDTGLRWPVGADGLETKPVLANDLFRAVHDAFGHGLEGAGFRARGEENAWQAHRRLFTGIAVAALTTETRGQNSWLNFGPYGERNRTASAEETIFADQKTGLLPSWAWTENIAPDMQLSVVDVADDEAAPVAGVLAEVAPRPGTRDAGAWNRAPMSERERATRSIAQRISISLGDITGQRGWSVKIGSGAYMQAVNPNFVAIAPAGSSTTDVGEMARLYGYVLDQDAVIAFDEGNTSSETQAGFTTILLPVQATADDVESIRRHLFDTVPYVQGDTLRGNRLIIGNFSEVPDDAFFEAIVRSLEQFEWRHGGVRLTPMRRFHSEYISPGSREGYLEGTEYGEGGDRAGRQAGVRNGRGGRGDLVSLAVWADSKLRDWARAWSDRRGGGETKPVADAEPEVSYGAKRQGALSVVAVHYSNKRREVLDSSFYGTGLNGAERERVIGDPVLGKRLYFYVDIGNGITPEAGVGGYRHVVRLNNLYDATKGTAGLDISPGENALTSFERAVVKAGYDGYFTTLGKQGYAVLLGEHKIEMPALSVEDDIEYIDIARQIDDGTYDLDEIDDGRVDPIVIELDEAGLTVVDTERDADELDLDGTPSEILALEGAGTPRSLLAVGDNEVAGYYRIDGRRREFRIKYDEFSGKFSAHISGLGLRGNGEPLSLHRVTKLQSALDYVSRFAAAAALFKRGHDLVSEVGEKTARRIGKFWAEAAKAEGATELPNLEFAVDRRPIQTLNNIAAARTRGTGLDAYAEPDGNGYVLVVSKDGEPFEGFIEVDRGSLIFHTEGLRAGSGVGKVWYSIANTFARAVGYRVRADASGLTAVNTVRRTENGMAVAARFGGESLIEPGIGQRVFGFNPNARTEGQRQLNLARLAIAQSRNVFELVPEAADYHYDTADGMIKDADGVVVESRVAQLLSDPDVRKFSIGRSSVVRALITQELIDGGNVKLPARLVEPVVYSVAEDIAADDGHDVLYSVVTGPFEQGFINLYVVPEVDGIDRDNPDLFMVPSLRFRTGAGVYVSPSMPLRIQVGDHQNSAGFSGRMFGVQHRVANKNEKGRQYIINVGIDPESEVESAVRDMLYSAASADRFYLDAVNSRNEPTKISLYSTALKRRVVLHRSVDAEGRKFWSIATVFASEEANVRARSMGVGARIGGAAPDATGPQLASGVAPTVASKLRQRGQFLPTPKSLTIDEDGLIVLRHDRPVSQQVPVVAYKKRRAVQLSVADSLPEMSAMLKARRAMQDYFIRVKQVQDAILSSGGTVTTASDVYGAEELSYGRIHEAVRDFAESRVRPLLETAAKHDVDLDELALYAYAMHAKERNARIASINPKMPDGGSGMTNDEADAILARFRSDPRHQHIQQMHRMLMDMTASTRRLLLDDGLITEDEYAALDGMYDNYVPLRGFENDGDPLIQQLLMEGGARRLTTGRGFDVRGNETMRALGRKTRAGQIIENIILDYQRAVVRGEKNRVARSFLQLVMDNPDPSLWEIDAETLRRSVVRDATGRPVVRERIVPDRDVNTTVVAKIKGVPVYIKVRDQDLLRAMKRMHQDDTGDQLRQLNRWIGAYTSLLRNTLTRWNPEFAVVNAVRDVGFGALSVLEELGEGAVARFAKAYPSAVSAAARYEMNRLDPVNKPADRYFIEYMAAGGTTGGFYMQDTEAVMRDLRDAMLQLGAPPKNLSERIRSMRAYLAAKKLAKALEFVGSVSEHAARAAAYAVAREMGRGPQEAARIAKNLTTNFNRKGEWGDTLNALFVFYNAAVQGGHRFARMLTSRKIQAYMAGITAASFAIALANAFGGGEDEDGQLLWDKIPLHVKERNLIIMIPNAVARRFATEGWLERVGRNGWYVKVPVQYGPNIFTSLGIAMADGMRRQAFGQGHGQPIGKLAAWMGGLSFSAFNPLGSSLDNVHAAAMLALPSVFDPVYQLATGTDSFGRPVAPFKSEYDYRPDSENVRPSQSGKWSHQIARWLNEVSGGDREVPGAIDIQPGTIENVAYQLTGGTGRFIGDVANFIIAGAEYIGGGDPDIYVQSIPVLRRVLGAVDESVDLGMFYERVRMVDEARQLERRLQQAGRELVDDEKLALSSLASDANAYSRKLLAIRKKMIAIGMDADMTEAEKRDEIRALKRERDDLVKEFNRLFVETVMTESSAGQ